ncbi:MAG: glycosyltransferase, partial [Gemmatimonadota bacterium]
MSTCPVTFSLPHGLIVGGVTTWTVQLADALAKEGRRTRLVVHGDESDPPPHLQPFTERSCGSEIVHAPPLNDPSGWQESVRVYRELLPSVLLPFALAENYAVAAALATVWPERIRVVGWTHSDNPYDYETLAYYESIIHGYVAISRRCEAELCRRLPTRSEAVTYLPHGVKIPAAQTRQPLADRPIRLIYAGRIEQGGKRVLDFVT